MAGLGVGCSPVRPGTYQGSVELWVNFRYDPSRGLSSNPELRIFRDWPRGRWLIEPTENIGFSFGTDASGGGIGRFYPWSSLASGLGGPTPFEAHPNGYASTVVMGAVSGIVDYAFVVSSIDQAIQPVGASGPMISVQPGFQILHRTCLPGQPNHFEPVPLDTAVTYRTDDAAEAQAGRDPYVAACSLPLSMVVDLGDATAVLPPSSTAGAPAASDLVWSPGADSVYFLVGSLGEAPVQVLRADVGQPGATQLMFGDLYGPLQVATDGTSLLVNQAGIGNDPSNPRLLWTRSLRQSLVAGAITPLAMLPASSGDGLLSPDGSLLAVASQSTPVQTQVIDVAKATVSVESLGSGTPLAWEPSGQSLLVDAPGGLQVLSLDGRSNPLGGGASPRAVGQYFWGASGPKAVIQDASGTRVHDLVTGQITELVEANRVAPPTMTVAAVVATEQVFAWALECFGIGETSCNAELRRLTIATSARDVVARAEAALPFAVSPDGTKLALADSKTLYIKSISP